MASNGSEDFVIRADAKGKEFVLKVRKVASGLSDGTDECLRDDSVYIVSTDRIDDFHEAQWSYDGTPFIVKDKESGEYTVMHSLEMTNTKKTMTMVYHLVEKSETTALRKTLDGFVIMNEEINVNWGLLKNMEGSCAASEVIEDAGYFKYRLKPSSVHVTFEGEEEIFVLEVVLSWVSTNNVTNQCRYVGNCYYRLRELGRRDCEVVGHFRPSYFDPKTVNMLHASKKGLFAAELKDATAVTISIPVSLYSYRTFGPCFLELKYPS